MRPIDRRATPRDGSDEPKGFSKYRHARKDLIDRLGQYCSYCGTRLPASLAVEHVRPKKPNPDLELRWDNFLLACTNCNSTKGDKDVVLDEYFWPDKDNTFRAFVYTEGGLIEVNSDLTDDERELAQSTIDLVGLDRTPANDPAVADRRWKNRDEVWTMAIDARQDLAAQGTETLRKWIVNTATGRGFWSVWMTVFADDQNMRKRLIDAFPGTSKDCFDDECRPVRRPGRAL
ncbi:MAG: HNH endonuclease [Candidatus Nealsonbacteria bacterium]|nr:HNH endonuclease [Candidatus Nealsonbacteria bacterium]